MKTTLDELQAFVAVVDTGSITAASELLGLTISATSRTLGRLEEKLQTTLLRRTTRRLELTEALIERGHAYVAPDGSGDVYFDVRSWPRYGELSGMKVDEMEPAADADPRGKRDPRDFALWKAAKPGEPSWPSPWGALPPCCLSPWAPWPPGC